jgi:type II secretory pathway pseudopilin PulG
MSNHAGHRGLTMIEAVVSLVIIATLGAAALRALSAAALTRALAHDRARGVALARDLLEEALAAPYGEPAPPIDGEAGEEGAEGEGGVSQLQGAETFFGGLLSAKAGAWTPTASTSSTTSTTLSGEGDQDRLAFDTVGDYDGWSSSPPIAPDGAPLAPAPWRREVTVRQVELDGATTAATASRLLRVTVRVFKGDRLVAEEEALRSAAWDAATWGGS